jgi:TRAP-type mannitol/chloroaromatic compound transport system substrate-binding protein
VSRGLAAALGAALALLAGAGAGAAPPKLRVQSGYPFAQPVLGEMVVHFRDTLAAQGRGDLRVHLYDAGRLVPTLGIFDAVSAGRLDAGISWPGYWMGKIPAAALFAAVPFGPGALELLAWVREGGGLEIWRRLYARYDLVPVPCGALPPEASGWFRRPIRSEADLVGLKLRYGGLAGRVLQKLGASIALLASGDLFVALERGVLDGAEYSMPAVDRSLGFYKVAKHYYFPGWHQPASIMELIVNRPRWEALPSTARAALESACDSTTLYALTRSQALQGDALAFFEAQGVTLHTWPPELLARFREVSEQVLDEAAAADPDFAEALASLRAFRAQGRAWREIAEP